MGGKNAPIQAEESIRGIIKLLTHFEPEKHNGNFYDYQGHSLQWWKNQTVYVYQKKEKDFQDIHSFVKYILQETFFSNNGLHLLINCWLNNFQ